MTIILFASLMLAGGTSHAAPGAWRAVANASHQGGLMRVANNQIISREEAAKKAQSRHGGRVISVQLIDSGKKGPYYRVKLLSGGNLRVVSVNASR